MYPSTPSPALTDWDRGIGAHFLLCSSLKTLRLLGRAEEKAIRTPCKTEGGGKQEGNRESGR